MISILENILRSSQYIEIFCNTEILGYQCKIFTTPSNSGKEEFFCLFDWEANKIFDVDYFLTNIADEIFENFLNDENINQSFLKNSTLLICSKKGNLDDRSIFRIEEDEYNFKKNLILYTDDEVVSLKQAIVDYGGNLTNNIVNNLINGNSGEDFRGFKINGSNLNNYYSLLIKIVLKTPFLKYKPKDKLLINLEDELVGRLSEKEKNAYEKIDSINYSLNEKNVLKFLKDNGINDDKIA